MLACIGDSTRPWNILLMMLVVCIGVSTWLLLDTVVVIESCMHLVPQARPTSAGVGRVW